MRSTEPEYASRLASLEGRRWKRWLPNPYRWHLRRRCVGRTLDVGCGIGRVLSYLGDRAVGVDPNTDAIAVARRRGFEAYVPDDFPSGRECTFDTMLCSHVLEHLDRDEGRALLQTWLPMVRPGGTVVLICPQERGQASDPTHLRFVTGRDLVALATDLGLVEARVRSFPLPRAFGRWWVHNETVLTARVAS